jgi:hypothetical protein
MRHTGNPALFDMNARVVPNAVPGGTVAFLDARVFTERGFMNNEGRNMVRERT